MAHKPNKERMILAIRNILTDHITKVHVPHQWNEELDEEVLVVEDESALAKSLYTFFDELQDAINKKHGELLDAEIEKTAKELGFKLKTQTPKNE